MWLRSRIAVVLYLGFLAFTVHLAYENPFYNWDLLAYVGCATSLHESNPVKIHAAAYDQALRELPEDEFNELAKRGEFRQDVTSDAFHFTEQLPFYSTRPAYIWALLLTHGLGFTYIQATRLVSPVACSLLALTLFVWTRGYVGDVRAAILSGLLLVSEPILAAGRTGSSDALSGFMLLLGFYLIVERSRLLLGLILLLGSLFARTDNVVFVAVVLAYCAYSPQHANSGRAGGPGLAPERVRLPKYAAVVLLAVAVAAVVAINHFSGNYGYAMLLRNTIDAVPNPGELSVSLSRDDYLSLWSEIPGNLIEGTFAVFALLGLVVLFSGRARERMRHAVIMVFIAVAVRLFLYPHIEDRYFIAAYSIIAAACIATFAAPSHKEFPTSPRTA